MLLAACTKYQQHPDLTNRVGILCILPDSCTCSPLAYNAVQKHRNAYSVLQQAPIVGLEQRSVLHVVPGAGIALQALYTKIK